VAKKAITLELGWHGRYGDFRLPLCVAGPASVLLRIRVLGRAGPRPTNAYLASGRRSAPGEEFSTGGDHRLGPLMHGLDDLGVVDAAQVSRGDREVCVPELSLDHDERDPLARHLHRMRVAQLMVVPTSAQTPLGRLDR